jgi:hypothetical protein
MTAIFFKDFQGNYITLNYAMIEFIQLSAGRNKLEIKAINGNYYEIEFKNRKKAEEGYNLINNTLFMNYETASTVEYQEEDGNEEK